MTADDRISTALHQAAEDARDRKGHRWMWVGLAAALAGLVWLAIANISHTNEISALDQQQRAAAEAAQTLAGQVRELGGTPAVQPPAPGERGEQGTPGRDGVNGRDGTNGVTPACVFESSQCRGESGRDGQNGADGKDGKDGTNGVDGKDGLDGQPGRDGVPPAGWSWVDGDGRTQSCARDAGSPDTAPTYTCTAASTGPPGSTTTNPPLLRFGG
ncbi:hypothetical protein ACVDFE_02050 [Lentzea chajnantorensis]